MTRVAVALILFLSSMHVGAACNLPLISGEYSLFLKWDDPTYEGAIVGKLEIASGGRSVLRGAKLIYRDRFGKLINREGSAVGRMGVAPQCTGFLELSMTDRDLASEVAVISAEVVIAGGRSTTQISGIAQADIKGPGNQIVVSNLLAPVRLEKINL